MEKHFAVIGDPIGHSLSPLMHEAGFRATGLDARYYRFRVEPEKLAEAVSGLKALGFRGWNVTVPHKENIIPFLDELTDEAGKIGAVNTVKVENGRLIGHNTDGTGFIRSIEKDIAEFSGKQAVILGAGGAAKSITVALMRKGMQLTILNRSPERAEELAKAIEAMGGEASAGELKPGAWLMADLLVQTTSLGLKGENYPFSLEGISPQTVVVDIVFREQVTPFLADAAARGCQVHNGMGMLLHQGALAWEFWWGEEAPLEVMAEALRVNPR